MTRMRELKEKARSPADIQWTHEKYAFDWSDMKLGANTLRTVFAQFAINQVAITIPIVSVRTVRNWEEIIFRIAPVRSVEASEATTTRTVSVPSVTRGDSDHLSRTHERRGERIAR